MGSVGGMIPHMGMRRFAKPARGSWIVVTQVRVASIAAAFMIRPLIVGIAFTSGIAARITLYMGDTWCLHRACCDIEDVTLQTLTHRCLGVMHSSCELQAALKLWPAFLGVQDDGMTTTIARVLDAMVYDNQSGM